MILKVLKNKTRTQYFSSKRDAIHNFNDVYCSMDAEDNRDVGNKRCCTKRRAKIAWKKILCVPGISVTVFTTKVPKDAGDSELEKFTEAMPIY